MITNSAHRQPTSCEYIYIRTHTNIHLPNEERFLIKKISKIFIDHEAEQIFKLPGQSSRGVSRRLK